MRGPLGRRNHSWRGALLIRILLTSFSIVCVAALQPRQLESQKPPWLGERYLRPAIYGKVYDSATQRAASKVALSVAGQIGIAFSDSAGWYLRFDVPVGQHKVQFRCSTERRWLGRTFATRTISISPQTDSVVNFYVPLSECAEPPVTTISGEWSGHYEYGFETSLFAPCVDLPDLPGTAYEGIEHWIWVETLPTDSHSIARKWPDTGDELYPNLFVRWRGQLTGPGSYGHLGLGVYQLDVREVLEVRRPTKSDCR